MEIKDTIKKLESQLDRANGDLVHTILHNKSGEEIYIKRIQVLEAKLTQLKGGK